MWAELYKTLKVRKVSKGYKRKKATEMAISAFEDAYKIKLPIGYRDFLQVFGPGLIADYFNVYAPGGDLEEKMGRFKKNRKNLKEVFGDSESLSRMIVFGDTVGGDLIAWDPKDVTDAGSFEYGIYVLPRNDDKISKIASDFPDFINSVCFGKGFDKISGGSDGPRPREFEPSVEKA